MCEFHTGMEIFTFQASFELGYDVTTAESSAVLSSQIGSVLCGGNFCQLFGETFCLLLQVLTLS
jgi:hypothetical protein